LINIADQKILRGIFHGEIPRGISTWKIPRGIQKNFPWNFPHEISKRKIPHGKFHGENSTANYGKTHEFPVENWSIIAKKNPRGISTWKFHVENSPWKIPRGKV